MSSHHIIRNKHEPALLIANGEACHPGLLGQLLEENPYVVVLDGAIWRVLELGIKIDVLLGDFDKDLDFDAIWERQYPFEIVHTPDQNKTDLDKGIEFLIGKGGSWRLTSCGLPDAGVDHSLINMTSIVRYKNQIRIVMLDDHSRIFPLVGWFEKWYKAGTPISLIPVGTVTGYTSYGLTYNLSEAVLTLGYYTSSSNEAAEDGFVRIKAQTGDLLIMECWD